MASFVRSSVEKVKYHRSEIENPPVNLDRCDTVMKARINWYPDNEGIPAISFMPMQIKWAYQKVEDRDADFERIVLGQGLIRSEK